MADAKPTVPRIELDLLIAIAISVAAPAAVLLMADGYPIRFLLAIPYLLFVPGWTFTSAIWAAKGDLRFHERLAYSIGLSIVMLAAVGLALSSFKGFDQTNLLVAASALTQAMAIAAWILRFKISSGKEPFGITVDTVRSLMASDGHGGRGAFVAAIAALIAVSVMVSAVVVNLGVEKNSTSFHLMGDDGTPASLPKNMTLGEVANVTLVLENHEGRAVSYQIVLVVNGTMPSSNYTLPSLSGNVQNGAEISRDASLSFAHTDVYRVTFYLYLDGSDEPAHFLHLWVSAS